MAPRYSTNRSRFNSVRRIKSSRSIRKKVKSNIRPTRSGKSTSLGGYVASGIRTLTSFIPGQTVVRPLVDMVLKAIGITSAVQFKDGYFEATVHVLGLGMIKPLYFGDLLCSLKNFGVQTFASGLPAMLIDFVSGKLLRINFNFEPTGKLSERYGEWAIAIVPIRDQDGLKRFHVQTATAKEYVTPTFEMVKNLPGAIFGPAKTPLSLKWIPKFSRDGNSAKEQTLNTNNVIALLVVAFSQEMRGSYTDISTENFNFKATMSATAHFSERIIIDGFADYAGQNSTVMKPHSEKPKSIYVTTYLGHRLEFDLNQAGLIELESGNSKKFRVMPENSNYKVLSDVNIQDYEIVERFGRLEVPLMENSKPVRQ